MNKEATALWFDPRTGKEKAAEIFKLNETREITPPDRWEDAILVLQSR